MPVPKGMKRTALIKGSYKAACAKGTIRTKVSGKARVIVCCPKGKRGRGGRCKAGMKAISIDKPLANLLGALVAVTPKCPFKSLNQRSLAKGTRVERREHGVPVRWARKIAADHLCENPKFYAKER